VEDERLLGRIEKLHAAGYYAYECRRMWKALLRAGRDVRSRSRQAPDAPRGHSRRQAPSQAVAHHDARPTARRPRDLVNRDFAQSTPDALWVVDFSYLRCWEGVVFFSLVIEAFSWRIVGWQFAA
jgi:putative transposase